MAILNVYLRSLYVAVKVTLFMFFSWLVLYSAAFFVIDGNVDLVILYIKETYQEIIYFALVTCGLVFLHRRCFYGDRG